VSFLSEILERKRLEVEGRRSQVDAAVLRQSLSPVSRPRGFGASLSKRGGPVRVIAEVKRASPSAGAIRADADAVGLAQRYARGGAAAISVLTDGPGFGGSLDDLRAVRSAVPVPVLRKDFIVDAYQVLEARAAGADAVLLIVAALEQSELASLLKEVAALGMDALVEVHTQRELAQALEVGAQIVGINNRDLTSFKVDLGVSEALLRQIPENVIAISESGVRALEDAVRLRAAGAANLLIGEALVRAPSPETLLTSWSALP